MGLLDLLKPKKGDVRTTRSALEAARTRQPPEGKVDAAVDRLVQLLLDLGIDGAGPLDPATAVAQRARRETRSTEAAIKHVVRHHVVGGGVGGFVTGLGGFVTLPVALPANVLEFYVQATRMVAAVATLRGYDVADPQVRTAVLLTLVGSNADEVLKKAGVATGGGRLTSLALGKLPPAALLVVNKALGFRLLRGVGEKAFSRLGRGVPLVGGVIGGGIDGWMMKRIAEQATKEFPPRRD
ncbi:MAG TPA: hypothetical protein VFO98_02615 [Marmoricola sp.]|jgi:hypothetical protein|nr:hypothetical protein [Marmoricola sp.]